MSQVRKFQNGGETAAPTKQESSTAKTYKLIINGREINLDQDGLADFRRAGSGQGGMMGNVYADIADALESGHTVKYNSDSNTISGVDFKRVDPKAIFKANENQVWDRRAQRRANRYARNNNLTHQFNSALASIGNINFEKRKEDDTTSSSDTLTSLYSTDPRQFDYNKGEDGTLTWSNGPQNAGNLTALNNFIDMLGMSEEDAKKKYSWTGYDDQIRDLRNWYTGNQNYDWEGLRSRIRENQLTENDWDVLRYMGFGENQSSSDSDSSTVNTPRSYEGSGFNNDALEQAGYYVRKGEDGNIYLYDNSGNIVQDKIYLRDTPWAKGTQWAGGAVYQGRLWTPEQIFNQNTSASSAIGSELFNQLSSAQDPEAIRQAILNSGWNVYGMNNPINYETFDSSKNYLKGFMDSLNNGTYYWNDITGNYQLRDGDNTKILQVISGNDRDRDNTLRTKYAVSGYSQLFNTIEELQNYLNTRGIQQAQGYRTYSPISQYEYIMNNGKRYLISKKPITIAGQNFNLYRDEEGNYYIDGNNGEMKLLQGKAIMDKIANGTVSAQELLNGFAKEDNRSAWGSDGRMFGINMGTKNKNPYDTTSYDQVFGFKKGGRVPILQMGGFFTTGSVGESKKVERTDNRVGQPQKLGTDKRLKTTTDSLNKTAGWLDAAGLATSWIPGVGTGIGILGSLARFGADVSKDGFQWKDAGNLAINLGLDALTLIPGLGAVGKVAKAGSKAAKLVKTSDKVARVAKAVSPLMSAAGATTGAAQIYGALNNPEGMTSEDFGNLLSGIANVGLGSKNLVKNYKVAKVAKKLSGSKPVETKDAFKIGDKDKWLKRNAKKVGNFGNRVIHAPGNFAKNNGSTLNWMLNPWKQSQIDDLIAKNWKTLARTENDFAKSLAAEYLVKNPIKSAEVRTIGNKIYSGTQVGRFPWRNPKYELTSTNKPKPIELPKQGDEIQRLLDNINTYYGRKAHSARAWDLWKGDNYALYPYLAFKKGGKIIKAQNGSKPFGTFVQDNNLNDPNLYDYSRSGIQFNGNDVDWTKTYGAGKFTDLRNYYLNNWDNEAFKPIRNAYISQLSTGNNNVDLTNFTKDDFSRLTQDQKLGYAHNLWTDQLRDYLYDTGDIFKISGMNINNKDIFVPYRNLDGTPMTMEQTYNYLIGRGVPEEQVKEYVSRNAGKFANSYNGTELEGATVTASNDSDGSQVAGGQEVGSRVGVTKSSKGFNWNPDDLIGLANLGYSVHKNNQMYGAMKDSIKDAGKGLMKEMPTEIYDRYQDHITPIYQEAANAKRQWTPISTDPLLNYSMRQANEDAAQALLTEGRLKASEQYTNYLDKDLAARRMYADQRRQIADTNRSTLANIIMQLGKNDAARRLANNQSVQNFVMEFRNKLAQDRQKKKQFQLQDAQVQAQNAYNAKYNEFGNKWMQEFAALGDADKEKYGTWESYWQTKDINDYNNAIEQASIASRNIMQDFYPTQLDYFRYRPTQLVSPTPTTRTIYYSKKGGKTPTYLKRHTGQKPDEAIWIQRNKDTAKALEKLHDAVIKLFMKALS